MVLPFARDLLPHVAALGPPFLAFVGASRSNLLAYARVQGIPVVPCPDDPFKAKLRKWSIYSTAAGLFVLVAILNFLQRPRLIAILETVVALLFLPITFLSTEMAVGEAIGLYRQRLLRKSTDGGLVLQFATRTDVPFVQRMAISHTFTSLLIIAGFAYHETVSICVLYTCSLYFFLSIKLPSKETDGMRTVLLGSMFISSVIVAFYIIMIFFFSSSTKSVNDTDTDKMSGERRSLLNRLYADLQWINPAAIVSLSFHIISITLRFDYANFLARNSGVFRSDSAENAGLDKGLYPPLRRQAADDLHPKPFPKPYFTTAILSLSSTAVVLHVALIFLPNVHPFFDDSVDPVTSTDLGGYSLEPSWVSAAMPMMVFMAIFLPLALLIVPGAIYVEAFRRGEVNMLWGYKEDWTGKERTWASLLNQESSADSKWLNGKDEENVGDGGALPLSSSSSLVATGSNTALDEAWLAKQNDLLRMQTLFFERSGAKYGLDTVGTLRAYARGRAVNGTLDLDRLESDGDRHASDEQLPFVNVLALAFDKVLLLVDESCGHIDSSDMDEGSSGVRFLGSVQVPSIHSVDLSASRLKVHTQYNDFAPSTSQFDLHFAESDRDAVCALKDALLTAIRNDKILKHLEARLTDKSYFKPGYELDGTSDNSDNTASRTKGKLRSQQRTQKDSLGSLRLHTKALFSRTGQTKEFYVYLFSEALVCIRSEKQSLVENWTNRFPLPWVSASRSATSPSDEFMEIDMFGMGEDVLGAVPPGNEVLLLKGRIYLKHVQSVESGMNVGSKVDVKAYPYGLKFVTQASDDAVSTGPFCVFFGSEEEKEVWRREARWLVDQISR